MKIKRLSILLLTVFIIGLLPAAVSAAGHDPYEPISALRYDRSSNDSLFVKQTSKGYVAVNGRSHGQYIVFEDVNFDYAPYAVTISNGVSSDWINNNTFQFKIDSPDSEPIATVYVTECIGWESPNEQTGTVTQTVTGVHDLYVSSSQPNNLYSFYFTGNDPDQIVYRPYENETVFPDMAGHSAEREVNALYGLGIAESYEKGNFVPELPMTRSDFAVWMSRFMTNEVPEAVKCEFSDVSASDKGYNEICYLYDSGLLSLNSEKTFNPYSFITVRDAAVILLRLLGYEYLCTYKGGYPYGYDTVARDIGISSKLAADDYLRRADAAKMIYSAIDAEYIDVSGVKNDDLIYTAKTGILYNRRGIVKSTGTVNATIYGGLLSGTEAENGTCYIDNVRYLIGETRANDYLGVLCEFYYKVSDDGSRNLIYIGPDTRTEQTIINGNINKFTAISSNEITYRDSNKKNKTIKIPSKAMWIYNHSSLTVPVSQVVNPSSFRGRIRVVDNGKGIETVFVEEYRNIKIMSVEAENQIITDEITGKEVDAAIRTAKLIVSDGQNAIKLGKVSRGSVAEVYLSYDKRICILIVKETVITSSAESTNPDGTVRIDGVDYYKAKEFKDNLALGVTTEFHINRHNEIVYLVTNDTTKAAGLLYDLKKADNKVVFYLITAADTVSEFEAAEKVYVDGERFEGYNDINTAVTKAQRLKPVLYRLNADGLLTMIDTPVDNKKNQHDTLRALNDENYTNQTLYYYRKGMGVFSNQSTYDHSFPVKSDATVMLRNTTLNDDSACAILKLSGYSSTDNGEPFVFYCTKRDSNIADILHCDAMPARKNSGWMFFDSISEAVNKDGEVGTSIALVKSGSTTNYWISPDNTAIYNNVKLLKKGDFVYVTVNESGYVHGLSVGCFIDGVSSRSGLSATVDNNKGNSGSPSAARKWAFGTVNSIEDDYVEVLTFGSAPRTFWCKIGTSNIVRVASDGTLTYTSGLTIKPGDKILTVITGSSYETVAVYD